MKHVRHKFSASDYYNSRQDYAQTWKIVDQTLYRLCRDHYLYDTLSSVTAKVVIIGRTYATGIERKVSTRGTQASSISQVAELLFKHREEVDRWFVRLGKVTASLDTESIPEILTVHGLRWSTPDTTTTFDNSSSATVHVTATQYSGGTNDTKITVNYSYNSQSATPASVMITKRLFSYLAGDSVILYSKYNGPSTYGYQYLAYYKVYTHPDEGQITDGSGVSTYESVTQTSSNTNVNPNTGQASLNANSQVQDSLALLSNSALPSGLKIIDSQDIGVGGIYVRNNTLTWTATGMTVTSNGPLN